MNERLTDDERCLMEAGHAIVAHCPRCDGEFFFGKLPMPSGRFIRALKTKCPNDKKHKLFMGPLRDPMQTVAVTIREERGGD